MHDVVNASYYIAFTAGLLSFLSPCILPVVPSYFTFLTGVALADLANQQKLGRLRWVVFAHALAFVLGFSAIFILLGATATALGQWFSASQLWLKRIGGALVILFGLQVAGILKLKFLEQDKRLAWREKPAGFVGSALIGMAFAAGWSPCIGPILASILTLASTQETVRPGVTLLALYSLGLGLPFLAGSLAVNSLLGFLKRFRHVIQWVSVAGGWFLVAVGIAIMMDYMTQLTGYLTMWFGPGLAR